MAGSADRAQDAGTAARWASPRPRWVRNGSVNPAVTWGRSGYDGRCHALPVTETDPSYLTAVCSHTLPTELLSPTGGPDGALCMTCALVVSSELPDPGPSGPFLP